MAKFQVYIQHQMPLVYLKNKHASIIWCNFNFVNRGRLWCSWKILFFGYENAFYFFFGSCNFFTFGSFLVCFVLIYLLFDLMLGFEMEANNKTMDDGSAESPTLVLEDEVCFVFFVWCSSTKNKPSGLICCELWSWALDLVRCFCSKMWMRF